MATQDKIVVWALNIARYWNRNCTQQPGLAFELLWYYLLNN